jgi:uncharacterized 2Fe-2S/4Fe-4S cluster protein (DUF4445 family)
MPKITFKPNGCEIEVMEGTLLLDAAKKAGVHIEAPCGGNGVCGKCLVQMVSESVDFPDGLIPRELAEEGYVLACKAKITGDVCVLILSEPEKEQGKFSKINEDIHLIDKSLLPVPEEYETLVKKAEFTVPAPEMGDGLSDFDRFQKKATEELGLPVEIPLSVLRSLPEALREADGAVAAVYMEDGGVASMVDVHPKEDLAMYGIAVDIGTTTVAVQLVNTRDGGIIASKTDYNAQVECGLDVISRINYAKKPERLAELRKKVLETINRIVKELSAAHNVEQRRIYNASIAGNTTMVQLFLGVLPEYLRLDPYTPPVYDVPLYRASDVGLAVNPDTYVFIAPSVGSYVGGDITSGLLCTGLPFNEDGLDMFIDLGTNGELVIGSADFMMGCACSAGPAFEGGGIEKGMRASNGAVERVEIDPVTGIAEYSVIGGGAPIGICGSGIISLISELFSKGLLDARGKLERSKNISRIDAQDKNARYTVVPAGETHDGKPVYITEADIDNFIRAKGAIFSACNTMLKKIEMDFDCLAHIYIAGGFGRYLNIDNAKTLGLVPDQDDEKFRFIGNSSIIGAYMTLISKKHRDLEKEIAKKITYIDLSTEPEYMDEYTAALFLPHTDASLFPGK